MASRPQTILYDVIVIGAGFAGLTAAMNAASDSAKVLVLEGGDGAGGQGGSTNDIRNLYGFPDGISGDRLTSLGLQHCERFGVEVMVGKPAIGLVRHEEGPFTVVCNDRSQYQARSVILATGLAYRSLGVRGENHYMNRGVSRGFPIINNLIWKGKRVGVVGGGNSGAQCCLFLSGCEDCHVTFLVRGKHLKDSMSGMYLGQFAPGAIPNLDLRLETSVTEIVGDGYRLTGIFTTGPEGDGEVKLDHLIVMVGAVPHTAWLEGVGVSLDPLGFIATDRDLNRNLWPLSTRQPLFCETSVPGLFAVGDVRKGNERRRATSAINEGMQGAASAIQYLTDYFETESSRPRLARSA